MSKPYRCGVVILLLIAIGNGYAQAQTSIIVRIGSWIGEELVGYSLGKVVDKALGLDHERELLQLEAHLSNQIKRGTGNVTVLQTELSTVKSQLNILSALLRTQPNQGDLAKFRAQIAKDLDKLMKVQAAQGQRIEKLETQVRELAARLGKLEELPAIQKPIEEAPVVQELAEELPTARESEDVRKHDLVIIIAGERNSVRIAEARKGESQAGEFRVESSESRRFWVLKEAVILVRIVGSLNYLYIDPALAGQIKCVDEGEKNSILRR